MSFFSFFFFFFYFKKNNKLKKNVSMQMLSLALYTFFISNKALVWLFTKCYFKQSLSLALYKILFHAKALYKMKS